MRGAYEFTVMHKPMSVVFAVVRRDGNKCHICGSPCDFRTVEKTLAITATRDHITPKCMGGRANLENLKLAHAYCNSKRGDGEVSDCLRSTCRSWIKYRVSRQALKEAEQWYQKRIRPLMETLDYRSVIDSE